MLIKRTLKCELQKRIILTELTGFKTLSVYENSIGIENKFISFLKNKLIFRNFVVFKRSRLNILKMYITCTLLAVR